MIAAAHLTVRPLLTDRPLGFDPRWLVRHAATCDQPVFVLPAPRYIGGTTPTAKTAVPCCTDTARMGFAPREYRALRRRLDGWELHHLRDHAADLAQRLEVAEAAFRRAEEDAHRADEAAEFWREQALNVDLRDDERFGITVDGALCVVMSPNVDGRAAA